MKKILSSIINTLIVIPIAFGQTTITGTVSDKNANPIPGANIIIENTYDGTSSGADGGFSFTTDLSGTQKVRVQCIGFETFSKTIDISNSETMINIILKEKIDEIDEVVISAGSFEASDKKKAVILNTLDIVTTASANADLFGAFSCLPGASTAKNDGRLMVRGGEAEETRTYIDELLIAQPYVSSLPNVPTRGRFQPFSFENMRFSTGAYSCEYGNALSAIVNLDTKNEIYDSKTNLFIMPIGSQLTINKKWDKSSTTFSGSYLNMLPYYAIMESNIDWIKTPESVDVLFQHRYKPNKKGLLKTFLTSNLDRKSIRYNHFDSDTDFDISLDDIYMYTNANYTHTLTTATKLFAGCSYSYDLKDEQIRQVQDKREVNHNIHAKSFVKHSFSNAFSTKVGVESFIDRYYLNTDQVYFENINEKVTKNEYDVFVEGRVKFTPKFVAQTGLRVETFSNSVSILPRISTAYKLTKSSQVSAAWGIYKQDYDKEILLNTQEIKQATSQHAVLNYQIDKNKRVFRTEVFHKSYSDLPVTTADETTLIKSNGSGYARGIDLFWRDKTSFRNFDYWVSYSFIDSERRYKYYSKSVQPDFISNHIASVVIKQYVEKLSCYYSISYNYSSGIPYNDPNSANFMNKRTPDFHDISLNYTYLFLLFGKESILHLTANNLLFRKETYGYEYKSAADENGTFEARAITGNDKPFILAVLGITF